MRSNWNGDRVASITNGQGADGAKELTAIQERDVKDHHRQKTR